MKKKTTPKKMERGNAGRAFFQTASKRMVPKSPVMMPMKEVKTVSISNRAARPTRTL